MYRKLFVTAIAAAMALTALTAAASPSPDTGRPFDVALTPEAEVAPFVGIEGASGEVTLRVNAGQRQICAEGTVDGFEPVLAHIHEGPVDDNGPIVVVLDDLIDDQAISGCVTVDRALIRDILTDPADYYVNVHAGDDVPEILDAIRGQLGQR